MTADRCSYTSLGSLLLPTSYVVLIPIIVVYLTAKLVLLRSHSKKANAMRLPCDILTYLSDLSHCNPYFRQAVLTVLLFGRSRIIVGHHRLTDELFPAAAIFCSPNAL